MGPFDVFRLVAVIAALGVVGCARGDNDQSWKDIHRTIADAATADPHRRGVAVDPACFQGWPESRVGQLERELGIRGIRTVRVHLDCEYQRLPGDWEAAPDGQAQNMTWTFVFSDVNEYGWSGDLFFYLACGPACQVSGSHALRWSSNAWQVQPGKVTRRRYVGR